jgi:RimJ/RimL family protein N-acetyltransferase
MLGSIDTGRLRLERWDHAAHGPGLAEVNAQPEVNRFVSAAAAPMPRDESDALSERIGAHWETYGFGLWAAMARESGQMIGFVGLCHPLWWPAMSERVEVGWRLRTEAWGQGYATEGARAALIAGFALLELPEIVAFVHPENERSLAVCRRLGMVEEAELPHPSRDHPVKILRTSAPPVPSQPVAEPAGHAGALGGFSVPRLSQRVDAGAQEGEERDERDDAGERPVEDEHGEGGQHREERESDPRSAFPPHDATVRPSRPAR